MWPKKHQTLSWQMITSAALWRQWCGGGMSTTVSPSSFSFSWPLTWWLSSWRSLEPVLHRSEDCFLFLLSIYLVPPHSFPITFCFLYTGLSSQSCTDAVGEFNHGHVCVTSSSDGASHWGFIVAQTVRPQQAPHFPHHDEEHPRTCCISANHHLHTAVCRWVSSQNI